MALDLDPRRIEMLQDMGVHYAPVLRLGALSHTQTQTPAQDEAVPVGVQAATPRPLPEATRTEASQQRALNQPKHGAVPATSMPAVPAAAVPVATLDASIAGQTWEQLQQTVANCQACGLCQSRKNTVFGAGSPHAQWMVVGEAPGEHEDAQGQPFVGQAGQLLDQILRAVGLNRQAENDVFITNVLKCRPPANRNPEASEIAQCQPYLQRQIALVQPKIIVALGRFAASSLLGSTEPLGKLRGQVHTVNSTAVVVSYHPAYLLRSPQEKAKAWDDWCLAKSQIA